MLFRIDPRPFEAALRQAEANALRDARGARPGALAGEALPGAAARRTSSPRRPTRRSAPTRTPPRRPPRRARRRSRTRASISSTAPSARRSTATSARCCCRPATWCGRTTSIRCVVINQVRPIYVNFAVPEQNLPEVRKYMAAGPLAVEVTAGRSDAAAAERAADLHRQRGRPEHRHDPPARAVRQRRRGALARAVRQRQRCASTSSPTPSSMPSHGGADRARRPVRLRGRAERWLAEVRTHRGAAHRRRARHRREGPGQGRARRDRGQLRLGPKTRVQIAKPARASAS